MSDTFDPYHRWLGIPLKEQPPHHYRLLGVQLFEDDLDVIETAADHRVASLRLHEDGRHGELARKLIKEVNDAKVRLLLPERKLPYDQRLRQQMEIASDTGTQLGEYLLEAKLGEGGMGVVYRAKHTRLGRTVAVKVLAKSRLEDKQALTRFEREIAAIGRVDHPNIVRAMDARVINDTPLLVMEYVEGMHLGEVLRRCGPLALPDACALVYQAAAGLQCAHEHGLVHRDIKPPNLMLTAQGVVKLLDLGLVRFQGEPGKPRNAADDEVTGTGQAMGTVDYMAPEQVADSHNVDIRADIYALGATWYKLLTGQAPFSGPTYKSPIEKLMARVQNDAPAVETVRRGVPPQLSAIVARTLARAPADRFGTPAELAATVRPWTAGANLPALLARAQGSTFDVLSVPQHAPGQPSSSDYLTGDRRSTADTIAQAVGSTLTALQPMRTWGVTALGVAGLAVLLGLLAAVFNPGSRNADQPTDAPLNAPADPK